MQVAFDDCRATATPTATKQQAQHYEHGPTTSLYDAGLGSWHELGLNTSSIDASYPYSHAMTSSSSLGIGSSSSNPAASASALPSLANAPHPLDPFAPTSWSLDPTSWSQTTETMTPNFASPNFRFSPLPLPSPSLASAPISASQPPFHPMPSYSIPNTSFPSVPQYDPMSSQISGEEYGGAYLSLLASPLNRPVPEELDVKGLDNLGQLGQPPRKDASSEAREREHKAINGYDNDEDTEDEAEHVDIKPELNRPNLLFDYETALHQPHAPHVFDTSAYPTPTSTSHFSPAEFASILSNQPNTSQAYQTVTPAAAAGLPEMTDLDAEGSDEPNDLDEHTLLSRLQQQQLLQQQSLSNLGGSFAPSAFSFHSDQEHFTASEDTPATSIDESTSHELSKPMSYPASLRQLNPSSQSQGVEYDEADDQPYGQPGLRWNSPPSSGESVSASGSNPASRSSSRRRTRSRAADEADQVAHFQNTGRRTRTSSASSTVPFDSEAFTSWSASQNTYAGMSQPSTYPPSSSRTTYKRKRPSTSRLATEDAVSRKRSAGVELPAVEDDPTVRPYACNFDDCPARIRAARRGSPSSIPNDEGTFPPLDETTFRTIRELREHCAEHNSKGSDGGEAPFRCALYPCDKTFKSLAGLRFHFQNASANGHFYVSRDEAEEEAAPVAPVSNLSTNKKYKLCVQPSGRSQKCPVKGCNKAFRQPSGCAYHISHTPNHDVTESMLATFPVTLQSKTKWWFAKVGKSFVQDLN